MVSPGVTENFHRRLENGTYSLPLYPTSLLLATNIELTVDVPFIFHTLPTLIKFSYDSHVTGGFGPFSFGPMHEGSTGNIKFRVGVRDNKISITLPGTQLIGYVSDVVPQHPRETNLRDRRSIPQEIESQFDQWLFMNRKKASTDEEHSHINEDNDSLKWKQENDGEDIKHLELLISPSHSSHKLHSSNNDISMGFSTNSSSNKMFT